MNACRALSPLAALLAAGLLLATFPVGCGAPAVEGLAHPLPPPAPSLDHAAPAAPSPSPPRQQRASSRFSVASENATATKIAMDVLARGGSATDAAIAAVLGVGVTQPVSSGIGGGGFALVWDAKTAKATVLDFRETAPIGLRPSDYETRPALENKRGVMTGVPGEVAGLTEMHARWGRLAFADVVRGAAEVADQGFPLSAHLARALKWNEKWVTATPRYSFFRPTGSIGVAGDTVKNPALAATLRKLAAEGKASFYEGTIAADILATARAGGSRMTAADIKRYEVIEREPLRTTWEGDEVFTMPPPSAGGLMMLQALHMHTKADLQALGYGTGAYLHLLAETFRGSIADRVHHVGDPAFVKVNVEALAAPARMKARRARIKLDATMPAEDFPVTEAGTTHLVVMDQEGNVVSVTSTVNNMFGAKLVTEAGFVLNDELEDFTRKTVESRFGIRRGPNSPRGGARPVSSMTPTIVLRQGRPVLALGGSGGPRIATGTTQVLLAHLAFDRPVAQAVADPRIETPASGGLFLDEATLPEVVQDLQARGEVTSTKPNFSAVQAISSGDVDGARVMRAAADPRKGGTAEVE